MSKPREPESVGAAAATVPSVKEILDGIATEAGLLGAFDETFTTGQAKVYKVQSTPCSKAVVRRCPHTAVGNTCCIRLCLPSTTPVVHAHKLRVRYRFYRGCGLYMLVVTVLFLSLQGQRHTQQISHEYPWIHRCCPTGELKHPLNDRRIVSSDACLVLGLRLPFYQYVRICYIAVAKSRVRRAAVKT